MSSSTRATRPGWSADTHAGVHGVRGMFDGYKVESQLGSAKSAAARAEVPTEGVPAGVHLVSELAPASSTVPAEILDGKIVPTEVPVLYYSLQPLAEIEPASAKVIFFVHGGGNVAGHPSDFQYLPLFSGLIKDLGQGCVIAAPSYRLATVPENAFPANLQDIYSAWDILIKKGYKHENITVSGDSAGAASALSFTYLLSKNGLALPKKLGLLSPAADLTYNFSERAAANADVDVFPLHVYKDMTAVYVPESSSFSTDHPLVSGAHIPAFPAGWPKTLIQVGTADQLMDASHTVARKLKEGGADVELVELPHVVHGFWVFAFVPERVEALNRLVAFAKGA